MVIVNIMTTRNNVCGGRHLGDSGLNRAFEALALRLKENRTGPIEIVVCGGSALILTGLISRTTKDVDVVALMSSGKLVSPDPMPEGLLRAATEAAEDLGISEGFAPIMKGLLRKLGFCDVADEL